MTDALRRQVVFIGAEESRMTAPPGGGKDVGRLTKDFRSTCANFAI